MLNEPAQLDLLRKLQEATTSDVDEERGSFKKGDKVAYNMLGGVLTDSDLIRTLGSNEHATRANHDNTVAEIVEAIGEAVSRYSIMFEDGFIINDVATSELKSVSEAKTDVGNLETTTLEDIQSLDSELIAVLPDYEKGSEELTKEAIEEIESLDSELIQVILDLIDHDPNKVSELKDAVKEELLRKRNESKTNEAEDATQTMKPQEKPDIKAEDYHMEDYSEEDLNKVKSKSAETGDAIREVPDDELKIEDDKVVTPKKESKLKEQETEFTPSRAEMKKIGDNQLKKLHKNSLISQDYWEKDRTVPEKYQAAKQAVARYEEELVKRGLITGVEVPESRYSFMKKQEPLWLCNECFKTFRAWKGTCTFCQGILTEKMVEQYGPGFTKEVFKVTWKNIDTDKEESTKVMAFDKADAEKEAKRSNREDIKATGPITKEPRKAEESVPFDLEESVRELVAETPGINPDEQKILYKALEDGTISNEWPSNEEIVDAFVKAEIDPHIVDDADMEELKQAYLKHILLTKAIKLKRAASESKLKEQEEDWDLTFQYDHNLIWHNPLRDKEGNPYIWQRHPIKGKKLRVFTDYQANWVEKNGGIPVKAEYTEELRSKWMCEDIDNLPEKGKTYHILQKLGIGLPEGDYKVTNVKYRWTVRGDLAKHFQVADGDNWWIAKYYSFKDGGASEAKEIKSSTVIEIVRSAVDPDAYNIRAVELPKGDIEILDTFEGEKKAVIQKGKEWARSLGAKFLGIVDEKKVNEVKYKGKEYFPYTVYFPEKKQGILGGLRGVGIRAVIDPDYPDAILVPVDDKDKAAEFFGESKLKEQETDTLRIVAKGIVAKTLATEIAAKENGQVVTDEDDEKKFMIIVRDE